MGWPLDEASQLRDIHYFQIFNVMPSFVSSSNAKGWIKWQSEKKKEMLWFWMNSNKLRVSKVWHSYYLKQVQNSNNVFYSLFSTGKYIILKLSIVIDFLQLVFKRVFASYAMATFIGQQSLQLSIYNHFKSNRFNN